MILIGRITKDASVTTLKDERKVVNFSIALNDWYKPRGSEQAIKLTTYVNCSYWLNPSIASRLVKGSLVELSGRLQINTYKGFDGEAKGSLQCHVNSITIHLIGKRDEGSSNAQANKTAPTVIADDLPF